MREWDFEMRQIVDVNRQLLAIDAEMVNAASLLQRAGRPVGRVAWLVRAGERCSLGLCQRTPLSGNEVLFFKSEAATLDGFAVAS